MKVQAIVRGIVLLALVSIVFLMTGCGGGASATTTNPPPPANFQFSASSLSFGNVNVGSNKTLTISMSNNGGSSVTVTQLSMNASVFSISGVSLPLTLNAGQSASGSIMFTPSSAGTVNGTLSAMSSSGSVGSVGLSGNGVNPPPPPPGTHTVDLSWTASSTVGVVSYNIYRSGASAGPYSKIGNSTSTTFTDSTVQGGQTYWYTLTAVDGSNVESATSTPVSTTIPTP